MSKKDEFNWVKEFQKLIPVKKDEEEEEVWNKRSVINVEKRKSATAHLNH